MTRALILALLASPAVAQSPMCAPRAYIVAQLAEEYGEIRVGVGLSEHTLTEVFASPETGTWTMLVTRPDGTACPVAAGENWMTETPQTGEPS